MYFASPQNNISVTLWEAHLDAQLAQLGDDGLHPLRLLHAPGAHVADDGARVGEGGHHRQRHGGVWDVPAVEVAALQLLPLGACA